MTLQSPSAMISMPSSAVGVHFGLAPRRARRSPCRRARRSSVRYRRCSRAPSTRRTTMRRPGRTRHSKTTRTCVRRREATQPFGLYIMIASLFICRRAARSRCRATTGPDAAQRQSVNILGQDSATVRPIGPPASNAATPPMMRTHVSSMPRAGGGVRRPYRRIRTERGLAELSRKLNCPAWKSCTLASIACTAAIRVEIARDKRSIHRSRTTTGRHPGPLGERIAHERYHDSERERLDRAERVGEQSRGRNEPAADVRRQERLLERAVCMS